MSKVPPRQTITAKVEADRAARLAREAAALRENLRRRKAQDRAREQAPAESKQADPNPAEANPVEFNPEGSRPPRAPGG